MDQKIRIISSPQAKVIASLAGALHTEIDRLVAAHSQAKLEAPFLVRARQSMSDLIGHLGSHVTSEANPDIGKPAEAAPAAEAAAEAKPQV